MITPALRQRLPGFFTDRPFLLPGVLLSLLLIFSALLFFRATPHFLHSGSLSALQHAFEISNNLSTAASNGSGDLFETLTLLRSQYGITKLLLIGPLSFIVFLLGPSRFSILLAPYIYLLGSVYFISGIARLVFRRQAVEKIAAFLWLASPIPYLFFAGFPLMAPLVFLSMLLFYLSISYLNKRQPAKLLIILLLMILLLLSVPSLFFLFLLIFIYMFLNEKYGDLTRYKAIPISMLILSFLVYPDPFQYREWLDGFFDSPAVVPFLLVLLLSGISYLANAGKSVNHLVGLFLFSFLLILIHPNLANEIRYPDADFVGYPILMFFVSGLFLVAVYLTGLSKKGRFYTIIGGTAAGVAVMLISDANFHMSNDGSIAASVSQIANGGFITLFLVLLILLPFWGLKSNKIIAALYIALLPLIAIYPLKTALFKYTAFDSARRATAQFIASRYPSSEEVVVYECGRRLYRYFWFFNTFELEGRFSAINYSRQPSSLDSQSRSLAVIDLDCNSVEQELVDGWELIKLFPAGSDEIALYRVPGS